nr:malonyltransferase [Cistanche tubulosa]
MTTTLLETCRVPPPAGAAAVLSVPLSFFDFIWIHFHPIRRLLFYSYPNCSRPYFLETLAPQLKQSLSLALKHYLPLSGNLLYPSNTEQKPVFRYVDGDSVSLTVAESVRDFDELVGNHARSADQFYDFVPEMPQVKDEPEYKIVPVLALQVTLFPDRGICIGFANHHVVGDASSIFSFMKTWSSICAAEQSDHPLPVFDRSHIKDPLGIDTIFWKVMRTIPFKPSPFPLPTNRVRATFTLRPADIKKLKDLVLAWKPGLVQVSSFVVTASYVWTCLVRSGDEIGEEVDGDVPEHFIFVVDVRGRVDPPVPGNYFGNCLGYVLEKLEHKRVVGDDGFVIAAEGVAEDIKKRVNDKDEVLRGAENWLSGFEGYGGMRAMGVSGSPRFDLYGVDFGWGRARKLEVVSIDGESYSMSLCRSNDSDGGLEIGLSLPKKRMEAFAALFAEGLRF